jgi:hypothetical protein
MGSVGPIDSFVIGDMMRELPNILGEEEKVKRWVRGIGKGITGGNCLLVATKNRLIYGVEKLSGVHFKVFPFNDVASIQFGEGLLHGEILVTTPECIYELEDVNKDSGKKFCEFVARIKRQSEKKLAKSEKKPKT